ncbi:MFS transporter [Pokkaliibacter sp. CJK22405]|uniref:MFS transporter n=1 Tax=Pokkaliibacter sp. CJK22405 TaxID=3384615 RepID=UPI003985099B
MDSKLQATPPYGVGLAVLALAVGGLAIGTGEFAAMSILPDVARNLDISVPKMGHMISAYALGVVVGAPLITILCASLPKRFMLIALMLMFAAGNLMGTIFTTYDGVMISRFIAGIPHGAYFGLAALVAASLVDRRHRGRAVSRVMMGLTIANIIGVPFATWLGQLLGWQWVFNIVGALGLLTALMVFIFVPKVQLAQSSVTQELSVFTRPQVWLTLGVVAIGFGGVFSVYTYITPTLVEVTGLQEGVVPLVLGLFGVGMTLGAWIGGWLADRSRIWTIVGGLIWNMLVLSLFTVGVQHVWSAVTMVFLVGMSIAVVPAAQTRLMDVAGDAQSVAAALNHSAFNIANAIGAWFGGVVISMHYGWAATGWAGVMLAVGGLVIMFFSILLERRRPITYVETDFQMVH